MDSLYGFRKVVAALVILAIAGVVVYYKGDVPSNFMSLLQVVFGAFVLGNGVEHIADAVSSRSAPTGDATPPAQVDLSPVVDKLDTHAQQLNNIEASDNEAKQTLGLIAQMLSTIIRKTGIDKMPDKT